MNEIWKKNREKLLARMEMFSAAVLFAGKAPIKRGDENYPFSPDRNFYYVTGIEREDCILLLAKTRTGVEETLYIPRDNGVMAKWVGANMTAEEATAASGIENIGWMRIADGSFIRLKDISLAYRFPKRWMKSVGLSSVQLKCMISNVALLYRDKKLHGQDPEFFRSGGVAMPVPRQVTFALKVGF